MQTLEIALIALSGVVITAILTWSIAQRRIAAEHITSERAIWRKQIRKKALVVHSAILEVREGAVRRLCFEFGALLNPFDPHDRELLKYIRVGPTREARKEDAENFSKMIELLLKHDWERAKLEAGVFLLRWLLEARRWGKDWGNENAVQSSGIGKWFAKRTRERRARKGLRWWEKYEVKWVRAIALFGTIAFGWYCGDIGAVDICSVAD